VYLAEHTLLRRPCAVKMLRPERGDPEGIARFEREVRMTAKLTHWNTIEIYDYGHTDEGVFYYAMEYLPGMSLDQIIDKHGAMSPARAVHLMRQVCQALREAHAIGLLHRDLKPGNIIVCERGKIYDVAKLLDFGLVKPIGNDMNEAKLTQAGYMAGTPAYMSPEQVLGPDLDARSDVYSLGATFYEVLTGQLPFHSQTPMAMLMGHVHQPVKPVREIMPTVPVDLEAIIMKCMEKKADARFQNMDEMEDALSKCACANQWTQQYATVWWQRNTPTETDDSKPETPEKTFSEVMAATSHKMPAAL
jgi:serine/threonine protein kinase